MPDGCQLQFIPVSSGEALTHNGMCMETRNSQQDAAVTGTLEAYRYGPARMAALAEVRESA